MLRQPAKGHRLGTDALLLAAATRAEGRIADVGAGAGLVGLVLARRGAGDVVLIERDVVFADCARLNLERAALPRVSLAEVDLFDRKAILAHPALADQSFDAVSSNPPYDQTIRSRRSPSPLKVAAHTMDGGTLAEWLSACMRLLRDGGTLTLIHRADRLADLLEAMPRRAGGLRLRPVHPTIDQPASRILVRATAGSRAPLALLPPFILHGSGGGFTPEAEALHRGRAEIAMQ